MMTTFRDHKVKYLTRRQIATTALAWWKIAERHGHSFNICSFVLNVLAKKIRGKGALEIKLYEDNDLPEQACVTFSPLVLHIRTSIWKDADKGHPYARHIIAHEVGHIVLHDQYAAAFSNDASAKLNFVQKEESAEEQANAFADLFLVPDHIALRFHDHDTIAGLCVISDDMAKRRLRDAQDEKHPITQIYECDVCEACSNFTLFRFGTETVCDTCGCKKSS
jgi:hypothetical protein